MLIHSDHKTTCITAVCSKSHRCVHRHQFASRVPSLWNHRIWTGIFSPFQAVSRTFAIMGQCKRLKDIFWLLFLGLLKAWLYSSQAIKAWKFSKGFAKTTWIKKILINVCVYDSIITMLFSLMPPVKLTSFFFLLYKPCFQYAFQIGI